MSLPEFRYHPDPVAKGNIKPSDATCICREQERGDIDTGNTYCQDDIEEALCPWCVAHG